MLLALCSSAGAQQAKSIPRIGFLAVSPPSALSDRLDAFRQGLRERGYHEGTNIVEEGGIMTYGVNTPDLYRRAAIFVDKILKGAKPGELPIEQPTKFEFIGNLKAAKQIGLMIPPNVLAGADQVLR